MESVTVFDRILPLALCLMMLGVGITLKRDDFTRILRQPRALLAGSIGQLLLLPLLGVLLVWLWQLPAALALGLVIVTCAPGGVTSNMITLLVRGDTALSVSLTAVSSLVAPVTLPLLTALGLALFGGTAAAGAGDGVAEFPVLASIAKLVLVSLLPVLLGVWLSERYPAVCKRMQPWVKGFALLFFITIVVALVRSRWEQLPALLAQLGPVVLMLATLAMALGAMLGRLAGLGGAQQLTLAVEVGIQNAGTALMVTGGLLHNAEMSAAVLIYGVLMQLPAFALILMRNLPGRLSGVAVPPA